MGTISTNAVIMTGGTDTVDAINNTGAELSIGDKVWLNKHYLDETPAKQQISDSQNAYYAYFFKGDHPYVYNMAQGQGRVANFIYNSQEKTWTQENNYQSSLFNGGSVIRKIDNNIVAYVLNTATSNNEFSVILKDAYGVQCNGFYLGDNLFYKKYTKALQGFNSDTGEEGEVYYTFNHNNVTSAVKDGNRLLLSGTSGWWLYDITNLASPSLLSSNTSQPLTVLHMTGLNLGDYIIGSTNGVVSYGYYNNLTLFIYQITDNNIIEDAADLPQSLRSLTGTTCVATFMNNILCIGTVDNVYCYKYENGVFNDLNISLDMSSYTDKYAGFCFIFYVSENLTTAALCYRRQSSSYVYGRSYLMKLNTSSDAWYVDNIAEVNSYTLSGFVDSVDGDSVKVKAALPKVVNLTLNFNAEPEYLDFIGEV